MKRFREDYKPMAALHARKSGTGSCWRKSAMRSRSYGPTNVQRCLNVHGGNNFILKCFSSLSLSKYLGKINALVVVLLFHNKLGNGTWPATRVRKANRYF